ncbi:ATP synthase F1 subunit delta [Cryomorphaceae bacterium 1068]|nr:ATP synthase F1 subunit delta [Cryomorphaceae bacterium 1068]
MHKNSKTARRYAKALLSFAIDQKELDAVAAEMKLIADTCATSPDLVTLLKSPVVKPAKKRDILDKIFVGQIGTITLKFLKLVTQKKREDQLPEIASAFQYVYREHQGIVTAEIITAVPLSDSGRKKALDFITKLYDKVELTEKVDKELIGGFIIRVDDKRYDESVARKLNSLKREFSKNPYISEL